MIRSLGLGGRRILYVPLPFFLLPATLGWIPANVMCRHGRAETISTSAQRPILAAHPPRLLSLRGGSGSLRSIQSGTGEAGGSNSKARVIRTPQGIISEREALNVFDMAGFTPPPGVSTQDAYGMMLELLQEQISQEEAQTRPGRGRTAKVPEPATAEAAAAVLAAHGASVVPIAPCGCEIKGLDLAGRGGKLEGDLAGALELLMAIHGFALLRNQGNEQNESGVSGQYLSAEQQCALSENFGAGKLHSTHGKPVMCIRNTYGRIVGTIFWYKHGKIVVYVNHVPCGTCTYMFIYIYVYLYISIYFACNHAFTCLYTYLIYVYLYISINFVCKHEFTSLYTYMYVHICIYMYLYIYYIQVYACSTARRMAELPARALGQAAAGI